jgi:hypothetical protein
MTQATNIGIVLVHGIGEQRRFQHLSSEVIQLIATLESMGHRVSVEPNTTQDSPLYAEQESWKAEDGAPLRIDIKKDGTGVSLHVHEVWWADLDDKETLWNQVKFWFWGLGMWFVAPYDASVLPGSAKMKLPEVPRTWFRGLIARLRLWGVGNVFLLSLGSVTLVNYLLGRFRMGQVPGAKILYQYVGDVKLYQDRRRSGKGFITDVNGARRVAIRRRMIRTLIDAARGPYERWYVLAHSLGTVVAWNGLMETAHSLPNYLSDSLFQSLQAPPNPMILSGAGGPTSSMSPPRPIWIDDDTIELNRKQLFAKLRGFVTYGSPLDKFAYLWPAIVPFNRDRDVWGKKFEWINVFDHTDPVGAKISAFELAIVDPTTGLPVVRNYAYKASRVLLLSHIKYFRPRPGRPDAFPQRLMEWVLSGRDFQAPRKNDRTWYSAQGAAAGFLYRLPAWVIAGSAMTLFIAYVSVPAVLALAALTEVPTLQSWATAYESVPLEERVPAVLVASAAIVTVTGVLRRIAETISNARVKRDEPATSAKPVLKPEIQHAQ